MKALKFLTLILAGTMALFSPSAFALGEDVSPEASEDVRVVAAKEKLSQEAGTLVVYAKGLCCPSCAIGVRKKISRLDFVDKKRFNKGVDLDTKVQLIMVAIAEAKTADLKSLTEAVVDAGYDPVRSYRLRDGQLLIEPLAADS